ncbi:Phd finger and set domain-containing protein [Pleurostoma richardsiae]|uniref:Phd finger and set domain-containing protein n=1 Tax=Pleurostoma richardsiae TaxID=41990 RepID=A0AA38RV48_9PEZI|nr:Phd finger and set domain-containing protein [Pleurostoma richardsiae]
MTEKLPALSTQIAIPSQTVLPLSAILPAQDVTHKVETVEEEPYTIKCICNFSDDDGNTIYCETCDTWQHIECFYPNNVEDAYREDFSHSCADCKPRPLDRQQAIERQKARLSTAVVQQAPDKRSKRPPSKSHKKKPKPTDLQLNGVSNGGDGAKYTVPHDQLSSKKTKSSHKTNHSISSHAAKRSPSYGSIPGHPHGHPPSPATTPPDLPNDFEIHTYSAGFLSLYDEQDLQIVQTNSFASLTISNTMSLWLREPDKMRQETGQEFKDVFQPFPQNVDVMKQPLHVEQKTLSLSPDTTLRWQYLTTPSAIEKDVPLMELNGQIGFQNSYCADPDNRWDELTSPLPFVFFHPLLPLYIDTRKEGSRARYVRRSCKPNTVLDTFLSGGSEYHFWLVSDRPIAAGEQITLPWDFRFPKKDKARMLRLLGLGEDEVNGHEEPEADQSEYHSIASWVHLILSEYGGCACDLGSECAFARFHRNYHGKVQARPNQPKKKRKQKTHTISPTSTGHATNSRAASEGRVDEVLEQDGSVSGSSRSKPPSRDMTPARQGSFDTLGILTEPTDRDKRKVAMIEDSFRKIEQQQQLQPPRKKKRISDGSGTSSTSKPRVRHTSSHATGLPNGFTERVYVDAGTSRTCICISTCLDASGFSSHLRHPPSVLL